MTAFAQIMRPSLHGSKTNGRPLSPFPTLLTDVYRPKSRNNSSVGIVINGGSGGGGGGGGNHSGRGGNHSGRARSQSFSPDTVGPSMDSSILFTPESVSIDERDQLLELSDDVRAAVRGTGNLGPRARELALLLEKLLGEDAGGAESSPVDLGTVRYARLDKLLADLLDPENRPPSPVPRAFQSGLAAAGKLHRRWCARFQDDYVGLDRTRAVYLTRAGGLLEDVEFNKACGGGMNMWRTSRRGGGGKLSELENTQFEPGLWWLNLGCARRDGAVRSELEIPTRSVCGMTVVPLVTGMEEQIGDDVSRYVRQGTLRDMHLSLILQVGREVQILRGYQLKSVHAPRAGVRYDGLYTIRQYGTRVDAATDKHRLELTLERVPGQRPLDHHRNQPARAIPRPSQLDDWHIYKTLEGEMVHKFLPDSRFLDWKLDRAEEMIEREH